jgi:DNA-binding transcriptional ArsR family regulator
VVEPVVVGAVAHPVRLTILLRCEEHARTESNLASRLDLTRSATRWHVGVLVGAGLLHACPDGYRSGVGWARVLATLEEVAASGQERIM